MSTESEAVTAVGDDTPPPPLDAQALPRGTTLGRYVVLSRIGSGGMGVVYACYDPNLDRKVAVKLLFAGDPTQTSRGRARLMQEAQALARVSDPNIVAVHDVDEARGHVYLAMEFVQGQTLGSWVRAQHRSWREVLDVYVQAARGLAAVHRAGLVLRDFKPDNAMLGSDGRVRVMDFGLAIQNAVNRTFDGNAPERGAVDQLTATGKAAGTPAYMAPEQHLRLQSDARADQFSWCVSVYEALAGERPFRGDSLAQLSLAVSRGNRNEAADIGTAPRWLRQVIERGLAIDPARRFESMEELLGAVEAGLARQRRNRWLGVGGVLVGIFAARVGWQHLEQLQATRACVEAGTEIDAVWNEHARADLTRGVLASGTSYGRDAVEHATPWIERQVNAWRSASELTCRRFRIEGSLAPEMYARASACLDERRVELEVLLETMTDADAAATFQLVRSAADLTPATRCANESELAGDKVPAEEQQVAIGEIRQMLARVQAMSRMGRFETALELADEANERARSTEWTPIITQGVIARAMLIEELGRYAEAESSFLDAFERAWPAGLDESAMVAANNLASLYAIRLGRTDDALRWGRLAALTYQRLPDRHGPHVARVIHGTMGLVHAVRGDLAEARRETEAALESSEQALGPQHPEVASVLSNLGAILQADDDLDGAREALQRAHGILEEALGPEHPDVALTLTNLAGIALKSGDEEQAIASWQRALAVYERARGPNHPDLALVLRNLAIAHGKRQETAKAVPFAERALAIYETALGPEHPDTTRAMVTVARLRSRQGDLVNARRLYDRAVDIHDRTPRPDDMQLADMLEGRANALASLGEHPAALADTRRLVSLLEAAGHPNLTEHLQQLAEREQTVGNADAACHALDRVRALACATDASSEHCIRAHGGLEACVRRETPSPP